MDKKYQIFLSSTYEDLRVQREAVSKAILEIGDIPVGMEGFSAADESQWKLIKRQIEQSDYYIVLVAHRYGSLLDGISFTEREYDFALEIGIPTLGFLIDRAVEWSPSLMETDHVIREKLENFKKKVASKIVSYWNSEDSLNFKVSAALGKQKSLNPRPGWVRATSIPGPETYSELARLGNQVAQLSAENMQLRETAGIEDRFRLVDALIDEAEIQSVILMYESDIELPRSVPYVYSYETGGAGSGHLDAFGKDKLQSTGFVLLGGGRFRRLTDSGKSFAQWLIKKGRKCAHFWTPFGGWGSATPGSSAEKWFLEAKARMEPQKAIIGTSPSTPIGDATPDGDRAGPQS